MPEPDPRPRLPERPCPVCGDAVEPLRAREVVLLDDGLRFLCAAECRARFLDGERPHDARSASLRTPVSSSTPARPRAPRARRPPRTPGRGLRFSGSGTRQALDEPGGKPPWIGLGAAILAALLGALASAPWVATLSALAVLGACVATLVESRDARREIGRVAWASGPAGAALAAVAALLATGATARAMLVGAALAAGVSVVRAWLDARGNVPVTRLTEWLAAKMPAKARLSVPSEDWAVDLREEELPAERVRAGQEVLLREGEIAPVDGVVRAGEAYVLLHPTARAPSRRQVGDAILAGAISVSGEVRMLASRVGTERALIRPASFGEPRSHRAASLTRVVARAARFGGLLALIGAAASLLLFEGAGLAAQIAAVAAVLLALPLTAVRRGSTAPFVAAAAAAVERGIAFQSARALDRAGRTATVALCSHGTITEGEPELVEVHLFGEGPSDALLALVGGAETAAEEHAIARAVHRYCERRGIVPESVRRPVFLPGRGVTAVAPGGEELVVGNRQLLLAEGVSVAIADAEAARAEARGQTVIFVALDRRVRAVLFLRDEERPSARAAVQRLIDLGMEVLLLSGDHRGTVEALARDLDIGHIKAELMPAERKAEVRRLRETGGVVAVVGRADEDEAALSAADVPLTLGAAGAPEGEGAITLCGEDVRDAAAALWLARAARRAAIRAIVAAGLGGGLLVTLGALGVLGPGLVAVLALGIDVYALPAGPRLLRRIELRLPVLG